MTPRIDAALAAGAIGWPAGRVALLRPPPDIDAEALPGPVLAVTGFRPDHDALAARGLPVARRIEGEVAGAVVFAQRAKAVTLVLIVQAVAALPPGAPVIVDGDRGDGIDSVARLCRAAFHLGPVHAKAHGKCFALEAAPTPEGWAAAPARAGGFATRPGLFSADGIDPGSALLSTRLGGLAGSVCDLGAGWGALGRAVLASDAVTALACLEAEADALDCARENLPDPRATFHWADAATWVGGPFDVVVTNPPFHAGRRADPDLGRAFLRTAARILSPRGRLLMVANRQLPYEALLSELFSRSVALEDAGGYKVIEAAGPQRRRP